METAPGCNKNLHLWKLGSFFRACRQQGLSSIAGLFPVHVTSLTLLCTGVAVTLQPGESPSHTNPAWG